jgi:hypothetical protein
MIDSHKCLLGALLVLSASAASGAAPHAAPPPVAVEVTRQGFCVHKTELRCEEVALAVEAPMDITRLPRLEDGRRGIYFYSDQVAGAKTVFVHVLEAEDDDAEVDYRSSDSARADARDLSPRLRALAKKLGAAGRVVMTPFRGSAGAKTSRAVRSTTRRPAMPRGRRRRPLATT